MPQVLENLCRVFDDELERQQNILAICISLGQAARAHDLEYIEAKTAALNALLEETIRSEQERIQLVRQVVDDYQLPVERQTLTDLITMAPEPWAARLGEFQERMRATLKQTKRVVGENQRVMRRALSVVHGALNCLVRCIPASGYDARGEECRRLHAEPNVIDQRG